MKHRYTFVLIAMGIIIIVGFILLRPQYPSTLVVSLTQQHVVPVDQIIVSPDTTQLSQGLPAAWTQTAIFTPTSTLTPTPSITPTDMASHNDFPTRCPFAWASGDVPPNHIETVRTILEGLGYTDYDLTTVGQGESQCEQFLLQAMIATIILPVSQETLNDPSAMGQHIRQIMDALDADDTLPHINTVTIDFISGENMKRWSLFLFDYSKAVANEVSDTHIYQLGS